ncbi:hypothetical protein AVEN_181876-1 [Araneus ventricosus]|uniref:Uncharacterized protein n=1 Tax=Araneus ventricosus TaxID=182803 RepID=A0A4Y2NPT2_ARAVE|nr:hypothetical protein AVEN_225074-1 [Araneus ventricosus]GBN41291.1 hypothetical protein AVEN_181876-1 [Araneus ventricosus]
MFRPPKCLHRGCSYSFNNFPIHRFTTTKTAPFFAPYTPVFRKLPPMYNQQPFYDSRKFFCGLISKDAADALGNHPPKDLIHSANIADRTKAARLLD